MPVNPLQFAHGICEEFFEIIGIPKRTSVEAVTRSGIWPLLSVPRKAG